MAKTDFKTFFLNRFKTQAAWAGAMGLTEGGLSLKLSGRRPWSMDELRWMEKESGGKVKRKDVRPDLYA